MPSTIKNFAEANAALKEFIAPAGGSNAVYTLERIRRLLDALGNPQDRYQVVHVAGTSGKTSTCYYMAALLRAAGQTVGLAVSPHIDEVNERVQINLVPLPEAEFCRELTVFLEEVRATGVIPTYFEALVAFAYWEFARQDVAYAVVEVGLGGLLDGTNVVHGPEKVCIITDIGLDHTAILGPDLASIAAQKAGIILPGNAVFAYRQGKEVRQVFRSVSEREGADLYEIDPDEAVAAGLDASVAAPAVGPGSLPPFQRRNWHLAARAYTYLAKRDGLPPLSDALRSASQTIVVPARMETTAWHGKMLVFDGAHNGQKMHALAAAVCQRFAGQGVAVLFGLVQDKQTQLDEVLGEVTGFAAAIIATRFVIGQDVPRTALDPARIAEVCRARGYGAVSEYDQLEAALDALLKRPESVLLVTGSFYLIGAVRQLLRQRQLGRLIRVETALR